MKTTLGLDIGTNSIGWALINHDFETKHGNIISLGSRIIPMPQDELNNFGNGQSIPRAAERTSYRGKRRLYQRDNLRRDRLHRVLNILNFLPKHYADSIDFEKNLGQFKKEQKLNYKKNKNGKSEFIFIDSFNEMLQEFKLIYGTEIKIPYDWTLYYLRKKALTQQISQEELSWILLNFNAKRGYYQLRGDEVDNEEDDKVFKVLTVAKLEDSGEKDKKTGKILYNVWFDNGWEYDKQIYKTEDWLNKTKEFIVTTKKLKDNSIKRSYKFVDSEKDWVAIKAKTELDIEASGKTVGEYIYAELLSNLNQKINGKLIKTIERNKFYKKELKMILEKQIEFHDSLRNRDLYEMCIKNLYSKNFIHQHNIQNKGFDYLFIDDIIFYQRPLKSKKSSIAGCPYETRKFFKENNSTGKKELVTEAIKVIPKSHPLFIEFRMWQFLNNLKIYHKVDGNNQDITAECIANDDEMCNLFDFLMNKKEITQKQLLNYFIKNRKLDNKRIEEYRWNYQEDKQLPMNETKAQLISLFKKITGFDEKNIPINLQIRLWHIIYSIKDKEEFKHALATFARKNNIDINSFVDSFIKITPYKSDYGAYSQKAIKKLLPLMRVGRYWNEADINQEVKVRIESIKERLESIDYDSEIFAKDKQKRLQTIVDDELPKQFLKSFISFKDKNHLAGLNTYQACYLVYERHSELGEVIKWSRPADIDTYLHNFKQHSLRNPIVEQIVMETMRTVRDIWNYYGDGKAGFFDEIHVELGREMKNSAEKRKKIADSNIEQQKTNERIKELLRELKKQYPQEDIRPYSPRHQEILKLYEEGVAQNPYVRYDKLGENEVVKIRKASTVSKKEIEKYKLWLEQGYVSPYTGRIIPLSKLFSKDYEIEHIIPQSRYFDNSLSNKVICESAVNREKSQQTAVEYLDSRGGNIVALGNGNNVELFKLEAYKIHCNKYFKKNPSKLKKLLSRDIPDSFIERQMNDTRYISKFVMGLLSNVVREQNEQESTSKNLLPTPGSITSRLKHEWGLNNQWNEIVAPRFKRLNEMTDTSDYGYWDKDINAFRTQIPDEFAKDFNKKRIDHRHHALDALVIACTTRNHVNYLNAMDNYSLREKLLIKNDKGDYTKYFQMPWQSFPADAKTELEKIVISFRQNLRVLNKTNNKTWQWVIKNNGQYKKELVLQTKGENWAIRKSLHKETFSGAVKIKRIKKNEVNLNTVLDKTYLIVDKQVKQRVKTLNKQFNNDIKKIKKHLKSNPLKIDNKTVTKVKVYEWTKGATAVRKELTSAFTRKQLESVTDKSIQKILENHVLNYIDDKGKEDFKEAFSPEGIAQLNQNIVELNSGKNHKPIYKVRIYEEGSKFSVSDNKDSAKSEKYVVAAKGSNLFYAIYWDEEKQSRNYETLPLYEVIQHQKDMANLPSHKRTPIPIKAELGKFLFSLSPNDLVYVPTSEEIETPNLVDFYNLTKEQICRIYKMVSFTGRRSYFIKAEVAKIIVNSKEHKEYKDLAIYKSHREYEDKNKMERDINGNIIKYICWKLKVDRLGNIIDVIKAKVEF